MNDDAWSFVYVTDMQPGSPKSYRFRPSYLDNWKTARKQIIEIKPDFMLVGGDITRDGTLHVWELEEMRADFESMGIPYYVVPGNMDAGNKFTDLEGPHANRRDTEICITSDSLERFESVFGPHAWSFTHKNLRVSGFCDMLLGSDLPEERHLKAWLEAQRSEQRENPQREHRIWILHYALFADAPDEPAWDIRKTEEYTGWYFTVDHAHRDWLMKLFIDAHAERVITGHIHCRKDYFVNNIHFDLAPSTAFSQWDDRWPDGDPTLGFFRFDVNGPDMKRSFVPLRTVSQRTDGYGPGGHPTPEMRDYSLAWEK